MAKNQSKPKKVEPAVEEPQTNDVQNENQIPAENNQETKKEEEPPVPSGPTPEELEEQRQESLRKKYDAGELNAHELDEDFTIPQIVEYAKIHDILLDHNQNKPELIEQVLKKESASEAAAKEFEARKTEGNLTEEDLEELTVPEIHDYANEHGYKFSTADNKPELIVQVALKEPVFDHVGGVKDIRKEIDGTIKFVEKQQVEDKEAAKQLFYSKCWLGKLLEFLGADNPYNVKGKIENPSQIPPTADTVSSEELNKELYEFGLLSHLEGTIALREGIQGIIEKIDCIDLSGVSKEAGRHAAICKTQAWIFACQAKFELGNTLSKIRNT